jgi:DNA-binding response OmpR family regulator
VASVRVLLVVVEPRFREVLARMLAASGFEVRAAADLASAQAVLEESRSDAVVLVFPMPGQDGPAAVRALADFAPVLAVVHTRARDLVDALRAAGAAECLDYLQTDGLAASIRKTAGGDAGRTDA